jgi:hypothetical protein
MNVFRWNLAILDKFLNFGYNNFCRSRHIRIEVSRCFRKIQVSIMIGFLGLDQCKVTENSFFFDEPFALKLFGYFWF